jgi:hypothetical protein
MNRSFIFGALFMSLISLNATSYEIVEGTFTWHQAKSDAEAKGGHLATITNEAEQQVINKLMPDLDATYYWLGGSDEDEEGNWRWVTGETFSFLNWDKGFPDNAGNEDYLIIKAKPNYTWGDVNAAFWSGYVKGYILEKDDKIEEPRLTNTQPIYYYSQVVPVGFSMISVPFSLKDNSVGTLFGPNSDIVVYDYDYDGGWLVNSYDSDFDEWDTPNHVIHAGTAIWILNKGNKNISISFEGKLPSRWLLDGKRRRE